MKFSKAYILFLFCFSLFVSVVYAEIYQCTDATGKTVFKDSECQQDEVLKQELTLEQLGARENTMDSHGANSILGNNLLKNADFDDELKGWKVPGEANWEQSTGTKKSGVLVLKSEVPAEDKYIHEVEVDQCVLLENASRLELSARYKAEKVYASKEAEIIKHANRVNVYWYLSDDCTTGGQFGTYLEPRNTIGWQKLKKTDLKPALNAKSARVSIVQNKRNAQAHMASWDDIALIVTALSETSSDEADDRYTLPLNTNYLNNADFRKNLSDWYAPRAEWSYISYQTAGSAKARLESTSSSMGAGVLSQCVNIGRNTRFDLGAAIKIDQASNQKGGGRLRVTWYGEEDCAPPAKTDTRHDDINSDLKGWQPLGVNNLVAPRGTQSAEIELIQSIKGRGHFTVYWDDVFFKAVAR